MSFQEYYAGMGNQLNRDVSFEEWKLKSRGEGNAYAGGNVEEPEVLRATHSSKKRKADEIAGYDGGVSSNPSALNYPNSVRQPSLLPRSLPPIRIRLIA